MTTPTTEQLANVTVTGAAALVVALIGIEPQALIWGTVGSTLGVSLAKPSGRLYAAALFIAATLTCALLGTMAATQWFNGAALARNVFVVLIGAAFHPAFSAFIAAVPGVIQWVVDFAKKRLGGAP